jgi:regulation of enolase protein 1 (concanavalin A-like superfamily)
MAKHRFVLGLAGLLFAAVRQASGAEQVLFAGDFKGAPGPGWHWVREHREAWRVASRGLEVRVEPGNEWGPNNDARNLLVRTAPDATKAEIDVSVTVQNKPTHNYEQSDLVWYYDDSDMVKIGQELVNGSLSVVMGREEHEKAQTVAIIPIASNEVQLRLLVKGDRIRGQFRVPEEKDWRDAGECGLPAPPSVAAKISLQFYQGPDKEEHWALASSLRISKIE